MSICIIRGCFLWLALGVASASGAELKIVHVYSGWREAASFKRISEYFDGRENTGGQQLVRTHPDQRSGYYFVVRTSGTTAPVPVKINLEVVTAIQAAPRTYSFAADLKAGDNVLNLGLTGPDWPDAKANPVAWRLEVVSTDGHLLAADKSYLWEKPGVKPM